MGNSTKGFDQWIEFIEGLHSKTIDLGLERLQKVAQKADILELPCPVVTVAGTNGKGSTVAILARLLHQAGLNVGTYTSPHLLEFNERIQVNTTAISNEILCEAFEKVETFRECTLLTFFEFTTLVALIIFKDPRYALDVVILEVGLGGRLDAVNLISANLAIITAIGFDHQEWLGESLDEIAKEKAGILRPQIPVILGRCAKIKSILNQAELFHNPIYLEGKDFDYDSPSRKNWHYQEDKIGLPHFFLPPTSVSIALAAYTLLRKQIFSLPNLQDVVLSLENMKMVGRAQFIQVKDKTVILDVAHNQDAGLWLAKQIKQLKQKNGRILAVWASLADKALFDITEPFKTLVDVWYIATLKVARAALSEDLVNVLRTHNVKTILVRPTIYDAFEEALDSASKDDLIVVFGSFFTVSQVLQKLPFKNRLLNNNGLYV